MPRIKEIRFSTRLPDVSFNRVRRARAVFTLERMAAMEVKLQPPILFIAAPATDRQNTTVQHLAIEKNSHTKSVIVVASLRPSPHHVAVR